LFNFNEDKRKEMIPLFSCLLGVISIIQEETNAAVSSSVRHNFFYFYIFFKRVFDLKKY
jgi:hypothetical protein